jgi:prevent-host-death family protein
MREFSTVDLLRDLTTVTDAVAREPVAITQQGTRRFVLMTIEDFRRLTGRNPRKAYRVDNTPPELAGLLVAGLDRIIDAQDDG